MRDGSDLWPGRRLDALASYWVNLLLGVYADSPVMQTQVPSGHCWMGIVKAVQSNIEAYGPAHDRVTSHPF